MYIGTDYVLQIDWKVFYRYGFVPAVSKTGTIRKEKQTGVAE